VITRPRRTTRTLVGRRTAELDRRVGAEIRQLRLDAGLTQRVVADAAGIDQSYLAQVELGRSEPSLTVLQAVGLALGADLVVHLYATTGPAIRDRWQTPILDALLGNLAPIWRRAVEVPVHRPARGVIDAVLYRPDAHVFVPTEIQSRIERVEQQIRWAAQKAQSLRSSEVWRMAGTDEATISPLLVVRATRRMRELVTRYPEVFATAYPASARGAYRALTGGSAWPGPALLWADVEGGAATLRDMPPRA
jgi:transcriptional regulator with XRE-family HTH domain